MTLIIHTHARMHTQLHTHSSSPSLSPLTHMQTTIIPSFTKQATSWVKKESEKIGVPARLRRKSWRTPEPPNLQEGLR